MAYFPFITDIEDMDCLVVGGGSVAWHKVEILAEYDVNIHIVAVSASERLKETADSNKRIDIRIREFRDSDINGMDFVVAATGNRELDMNISKLCKKQRIPVNVVDIKEACSFIFPAVIYNNLYLLRFLLEAQVLHLWQRLKEILARLYQIIMPAWQKGLQK